MMPLSRKSLFAVTAVLDIAYHGGTRSVQSQEITARQGIPRRYLEQVLQNLVKAGILRGVRGPRGGYRLARERRNVSIGDIVRVVAQLEGGWEPPKNGSDLWCRVVLPVWSDLRTELLQRLDETSVQDLCLGAQNQGVPEEGAEELSYSI